MADNEIERLPATFHTTNSESYHRNCGTMSKTKIFINQVVRFIILNIYSDHDETE
jgi:hypothetical protein